MSDPKHNHGMSDKGHSHGVHDPGHSHSNYQAFEQERSCYQFLSTLENDFKLCPKLIKASPELLLLEDLGPDRFDYDSDEAVMLSIATTFAKLHSASQGKYQHYQQLREKRGIADTGARQYSNQQCRWFFQSGSDLIATVATQLSLATDEFTKQMAQVQHAIDNPGEFQALVHGDILNRRQSVSIDGAFYLLDFEQARYTHALIDIATTLVGKFDLRRATQRYFLNHPEFTIDFAESYRQILQTEHNISYSQQQWQQALASALIYVSLINIAALMEIPEHYQGHQSINDYFKGLLLRLLDLLAQGEEFAASKDLFQRVADKVGD